ncbi:MAG: DUF4139 domain-containing protein [Rhodanobacter sp.]|nr:MAG: DUF4139 domain-containing protein [Rhodanobacter sp.]
MKSPYRTIRRLAFAVAATIGTTALAQAAEVTQLTVYRSDNAGLYASQGSGDVDAGYAVVHEQRLLQLTAGVHDVTLGDLPTLIDPEALALGFPGSAAKVVSQRLMLARGTDAAVAGLSGRHVEVLGANGGPLASGVLLRAGDGLLVRDDSGNTTLISHYAAVRSHGTTFPTGARLSLRVDADRSGQQRAVLSYPTAGLGWRAAYVATLLPGTACRMQFESRASIANRSGRDWRDIRLTLIAGAPNFAKASAPRPMMALARSTASASLPRQTGLADYRSYRLPLPIDLPDGSISQVPLYADRRMTCQRTALFETGNAWLPPQPMLSRNFNQNAGGPIISTLTLHAFDSLPAGYLRVLTEDRQGTPQFIGEGRIDDTPKGGDATITLGTAFDLRAQQTRTRFEIDKAGRTLEEAFRIELSNAGDSPRTVTVRAHPNRWRQWTLLSSSSKPTRQTIDTLEFRIKVPANGKTQLDYAVRYHWNADQQPH